MQDVCKTKAIPPVVPPTQSEVANLLVSINTSLDTLGLAIVTLDEHVAIFQHTDSDNGAACQAYGNESTPLINELTNIKFTIERKIQIIQSITDNIVN